MRTCLPVLLVFQVAESEPCRGLTSELEEAAVKIGTRARLYTIDANDQPELIKALQISSIPTWLVLHNGRLLERDVGAKSKKQILSMLARYLR